MRSDRSAVGGCTAVLFADQINWLRDNVCMTADQELKQFREARPYLRTGLAVLIYAASGSAKQDIQAREEALGKAYNDADDFLEQLGADLGGSK